MDKILMKMTKIIEKVKFPFLIIIIGIPAILIVKNTEYEIIEKDGKEIVIKLIKEKYFFIMFFTYLSYVIIASIYYIIEFKRTEKRKIITTIFIFMILIIAYLIFTFFKNYKIFILIFIGEIMFKLMSKVKRLMKIHVEIENEYINHVKNYIPEKDFKYENIELSENEYIQKIFLVY